MPSLLFSLATVALYLCAAFLFWRRLKNKQGTDPRSKTTALLLGIAAVICHAFIVQESIVVDLDFNLSFSNVASLATWFITGLLLLSAIQKPVENLAIGVLPIAALTVVMQLYLPGEHLLTRSHSRELGVHILFSILAYSLLGLAAVQAVVLSVQERHLHNRQPGGLIRALPPMITMEGLLFQMLIAGFLLQSLSLITGFIFLENMFDQHMVHKTVLSILAWTVFAVLLWGHWRYGWRGRTAVRWTLSGFVTLLLAYFGSKYVLEIILSR